MKRESRPQSERFALYGAAFIIFFLPFYNALTSFGIGLIGLSFLINLSKVHKTIRFNLEEKILFFYLVIFLAATITSLSIPESLIGLKKLFMHLLVFMGVKRASRVPQQRNFLIGIMLASVFFTAADGLFQIITGQDWFSSRPLMHYPHLGIARATAAFKQAGSLGIFLGAGLPLCLVSSLALHKGIWKTLALCGCCLVAIVLTATFAPGAGIGMITALIFLAAIKKQRTMIPLVLLTASLFYFLLPESLTNWPNGSVAQTTIGRITMWKTALYPWLSRPWTGMGPHTFHLVYLDSCSPGQPFCQAAGSPYAHNMFVQIAVETGLLGLCAFFLFTASIVRLLLRESSINTREDSARADQSLGLFLGLIAFLTHGFFESSLQTSQGAILFWILAGLASSLNRTTRSRN